MPRRPWYADGVRFGCTESGRCCQNHGEFNSVYFTKREERALADHLEISLRELRARYLKREDGYRVARSKDDACIFLDGCSCSIYAVRPVPCRTWPFWPETIAKRDWERDVVPLCRGVGRGALRSREEIEEAMHRKAEHDRELENE